MKVRLPDLLPEWSVRRLVEIGAHAIKILLYYNPFDQAQVNSIKQAYIERIGAECIALDIPFFLEPLVYDESLGDEKEHGIDSFAHHTSRHLVLQCRGYVSPLSSRL